MSPLDVAATRAFTEALDILQSFSSHLPMSFLHVRGLFLRDGAEDGIPEVGEQRRNSDGDSGQGGDGE